VHAKNSSSLRSSASKPNISEPYSLQKIPIDTTQYISAKMQCICAQEPYSLQKIPIPAKEPYIPKRALHSQKSPIFAVHLRQRALFSTKNPNFCKRALHSQKSPIFSNRVSKKYETRFENIGLFCECRALLACDPWHGITGQDPRPGILACDAMPRITGQKSPTFAKEPYIFKSRFIFF